MGTQNAQRQMNCQDWEETPLHEIFKEWLCKHGENEAEKHKNPEDYLLKKESTQNFFQLKGWGGIESNQKSLVL